MGSCPPELTAVASLALIAVFGGCFLDATGEAPLPGSGTGAGGGNGGGSSNVGGEGGSPAPAVCGDGVLAGSEECDDQNAVPGDGCDAACTMECASPLAKDPVTHHCYGLGYGSMSWGDCKTTCDGAGFYLASLRSEAEFQFIATFLAQAGWPGDVWVGGFQTGPGAYAWVDGEPWDWSPNGFTGWKPGEPTDDDGDDEDNIAIWDPSDSTLQWLADASEDEDKDCLCERDPAGS